MLDKRLTNLLGLLAQDEFQTAEQLAKKMKFSSRTLRSLIKELNEELTDNGAHIVTKRGEGYLLAVDDFEAFRSMFISYEEETPVDSAGRVDFIIESFLKAKDYIKTEELCDAVFVCRKTLAADIRKAEEFFTDFHMKIIRKPHYGMKLSGNEFQKRMCFARYFQAKNGQEAEYAAVNGKVQGEIAECLMEVFSNVDYHISDVALNSLVLHVYISIKRIEKGQYISLREKDYQELIGEEEISLAKQCAGKLGQYLSVSFPEDEIMYLAIHLAGKESNNENLVINEEIQGIVVEMLNEIYDTFQIDLREDLELRISLGRHLVPLIIRINYGMKLSNPLLDEVRERYSLAYTMAIQACSVLERYYHCILDSDEVSYIALAIALSMERQRTQIDKKRVLLVCASGAGTARLMAYKMQDSFGEYLEEILISDQHSVRKQDFSRIDYIFTTVPIREKVPVPICEVKQLMGMNDVSNIRLLLNKELEEDILSYYPEELFFEEVDVDNKEAVLKYLCNRIAETRLLPAGFYNAVLKRERLARTCMGNHVAMPHPCKVMTEDTFVSVAILKHPILWDENEMVQAVFLVSVSKKKNKKIQNFYATTARLLLSRNSMEALIQKPTYETLADLLITTEKERNQ